MDAQFGLAYNDYAGRRFISVGAVDRQANADYEGYQFLTKFELGRDLTLPNEFEFTPSLGLSWAHVEINDYTETGAGASNLIVNDQDYDILNFSLRGEFRRTWDINQGSLTPEVHLGYNFEGALADVFSGMWRKRVPGKGDLAGLEVHDLGQGGFILKLQDYIGDDWFGKITRES